MKKKVGIPETGFFFFIACFIGLKSPGLVWFLSSPLSEGTVHSLNEGAGDLCVRRSAEGAA